LNAKKVVTKYIANQGFWDYIGLLDLKNLTDEIPTLNEAVQQTQS